MALAPRQDEARLAKAILSRVGDILLSTKSFALKLLGKRIVDRGLLLSDGNVSILGEAHYNRPIVFNRRLHHRMGSPTRFRRTITATYKNLVLLRQ